METILVGAQQQGKYHSRGRSQISKHFVSSPLHGFRSINCRTFHYEAGAPPSFPPVRTTSYQEAKSPYFYSEQLNNNKKSRPIAMKRALSLIEDGFIDDTASTELFAGPAFSNSPPPSSLPIPKFSLRQNRSNSLELPVSKREVVLGVHAKSAPSSPTKGSCSSSLPDTVIATENLRKILHLDLTD